MSVEEIEDCLLKLTGMTIAEGLPEEIDPMDFASRGPL